MTGLGQRPAWPAPGTGLVRRPRPELNCHNQQTMLDQLRQMPNGVRFLLTYALLMLSGLALTLPLVVEQAVEAPISVLGLLWMLLIAYLIFTITLVLQRKQSAWALSIGLATLSLPLIFVLWQWGGIIAALAGVLLAGALFLGLRRPAARAWFNEP